MPFDHPNVDLRQILLLSFQNVDCFADEPEFVEAAVRGAYDRNLLSMQDINQAVRRSFATRIRLGMINKKEDDPFANPDE